MSGNRDAICHFAKKVRIRGVSTGIDLPKYFWFLALIQRKIIRASFSLYKKLIVRIRIKPL